MSGGLVASIAAGAGSAAGGVVSLQATSASVQNPGDTGQICVVLGTGGQQIAGTQNKLVWDGNCATLTSASNCAQVGSHGKNVVAAFDPQNDFAVKVLVLSLGDVNPIPDGPLYCCAFEGEADPGQCCNITVIDTLASPPNPGPGQPAITALGNTATLCTASASNQPGRASIGGPGQPLSTSNAAPGDGIGSGMGSGATTSAPQPAPPAGSGAPPVQVLQGGGARVENPPVAGVPAAPLAATPALGQAPAQPAAGVPLVAGAPPAVAAPLVPGAPAAGGEPKLALPPSTAAATSAPTQAPTKAAPPDTPTVQASIAPATAATKAAASKPQQAMPAANTSSGGGLFGCQIAGTASGVPLVGLGLLALVARTVRRRARRRPDSRTQ